MQEVVTVVVALTEVGLRRHSNKIHIKLEEFSTCPAATIYIHGSQNPEAFHGDSRLCHRFV